MPLLSTTWADVTGERTTGFANVKLRIASSTSAPDAARAVDDRRTPAFAVFLDVC